MIGAVLSVENGLLKRWCSGQVGRSCGHYITTREETWQTGHCDRFHQPKYIGWRMDSVTKREMTEFIMHQPHCRTCLEHDNSYLFPAWYDLSREDAARIADLYVDNYPASIRQPFFHVNYDSSMTIRLRTHDIGNHGDGDLDLNTLTAKFHICTADGSGKTSQGWMEPEQRYRDGEFVFEQYRFDLSVPTGWTTCSGPSPNPAYAQPEPSPEQSQRGPRPRGGSPLCRGCMSRTPKEQKMNGRTGNEMMIPPERTDGKPPTEEQVRAHRLRQIIGKDPEGRPALLTGEDLTWMIDSINQHLAENDLTPLVPTDHREWTPGRTRHFLELAVNEFSWKSHRVHHTWWHAEDREWQEIVLQYPRVFPRDPQDSLTDQN